jgi:hypothetical protein
MVNRILRSTLVLIVWLFAVNGAVAAESQKPELLLVYWSSEDCRWCTWWESSMSGMERRLRESEEFKKITYRVVKNKRLADPYAREDFPQDIWWIFERVQRGEEKRTGRPGWVMYVDRKRIASFYGTKNWDEKHLPEIKRLVATHSGI